VIFPSVRCLSVGALEAKTLVRACQRHWAPIAGRRHNN
jgi:hypothetical protein